MAKLKKGREFEREGKLNTRETVNGISVMPTKEETAFSVQVGAEAEPRLMGACDLTKAAGHRERSSAQ